MGRECLGFLDGMFAFAFYDAVKKRILLARNTVGIKPLYYIKTPGYFEFSSELKNTSLEPNLESLKEVVSNGHFEEGLLPFRNVHEVNGGHLLEVDVVSGEFRVRHFLENRLIEFAINLPRCT